MNGWKILGGTLLVIGAVIATPVIVASKLLGAKGKSDDDSKPDPQYDPTSPYNDYP